MSIKKWITNNRDSAWKLGVLLNGYEDLKANKIQFVSNGIYEGKKWFADPFILSYDDNCIYLLVEEYDYKINKGRIAKICIDRKQWAIVDCKILLDLPTHLSFPTIYRMDDKIIVCPENYSGGGFFKYEYDTQNEVLRRVGTISEEKLVDTIIIYRDGFYYMLSTYEPWPNGSMLTIYKSVLFDGPFEKCQEIKFKDNTARNAGFMFEHNGELIRPAQESNYSYGHALVFQRALFNDGNFEFIEEWRYSSTHPSFKLGAHTYNEYKGLGVMDFKGYRNTIVGTLFKILGDIRIKVGLNQRRLLK